MEIVCFWLICVIRDDTLRLEIFFCMQLTKIHQQLAALIVKYKSKWAENETLQRKLHSAEVIIKSLQSKLAQLEAEDSGKKAREKDDAGKEFFCVIFCSYIVSNRHHITPLYIPQECHNLIMAYPSGEALR